MENCVAPGLDEFDVLLEVVVSLVRVLWKETIQISENEKLLGVYIDNKLSWSQQIENTIRKCNCLLHLPNRIKCYLENCSLMHTFFPVLITAAQYGETLTVISQIQWSNFRKGRLELF